jgi:hypothetical protein
MQFQGYYINLSSSIDRDAEMQRQLNALGMSGQYQRFEAVSGAESPQLLQTSLPPGHLGCWLSHQAVWARGKAANRHVHVLEDDAVLAPFLVTALKGIELDEDSWDLLFTDVYFHPPPTPEQFVRLRQWRRAFADSRKITLADLRYLPFTGTTSYLVNRRSIDKLMALVDGQWKQNKTLDVHLQGLVREGRLRALVTIPFLSGLGSCNVDSTTGSQGPALEALNAFREALYYQADLDEIYARISPCDCSGNTEPFLGIYLELLRNVLGNLKVIEPPRMD